ncbi:MAG TPA: methyltransferase domain-containing protein [Epulopiscium sp.]|nr:methyltransferase domain-containing protein [Candidatus Epulonipiscium sp.]
MTLDYYNRNAIDYSKETISAEFQERRNMLLKYLKPNARILDLGCGSGRDSKAFIQQGYQVTAMDGSNELCKIASKYIGQAVICRRFQDLRESNTYDAVWACASLLHVPLVELSNILSKVAAALKTGGYFYGSFKQGEFEGERNGRYFTDLTKEKLQTLLGNFVELELVEVEITRDVREGRGEEMWLNFVVRKV